jgi:hypothetical protein
MRLSNVVAVEGDMIFVFDYFEVNKRCVVYFQTAVVFSYGRSKKNGAPAKNIYREEYI